MPKQNRGPYILAAGAAAQLLTGIPAAWGVFQQPVMQGYGFSRGQAMLAFAVLVAAYGVGCAVGGLLQDARGPRFAGLWGTALLAGGFFAAALVPPANAALFLVVYSVPAGLGSAFLAPAVLACAQKWYQDKKGWATGVAGVAMGLSGAFFTVFVRGVGEAFVLECTARGIATCWLGASYKKSKVREFVDIKEDETLACIIAFGFYDGKVKHTKKKSIEQLTGLNAAAFSALPAWQQEAVNCARLSPSALNKQPWELDIKEDSIELINNSNNWGFGGVDCGIAMLHLELGAEFRGVFGEWKFKDGAPVFIPLPQSANCHDESEAYDEEDEYNDEFRYEGSSSADDAAESDIPNVEVESSYNFNIG